MNILELQLYVGKMPTSVLTHLSNWQTNLLNSFLPEVDDT